MYYISIYDSVDSVYNIPLEDIPTTDISIKRIVGYYVECSSVMIEIETKENNKHYIECYANNHNDSILCIIRNYKIKITKKG